MIIQRNEVPFLMSSAEPTGGVSRETNESDSPNTTNREAAAANLAPVTSSTEQRDEQLIAIASRIIETFKSEPGQPISAEAILSANQELDLLLPRDGALGFWPKLCFTDLLYVIARTFAENRHVELIGGGKKDEAAENFRMNVFRHNCGFSEPLKTLLFKTLQEASNAEPDVIPASPL